MVFLLDLPTEILCRILSYLPAVDLCIAQRTSHHINRIITSTTELQYTLRAYMNGVDDLLPPDCPFSERLDLLKQYEKSWSNLQLDRSAEFPINTEAPYSDWYTLQDGYFICRTRQEWGSKRRYGYLDLCATRGKGASWVRIQIQDPYDIKRHLNWPVKEEEELDWVPLYSASHDLDLMFSVDHDLVVSISILQLLEQFTCFRTALAFFEFTTGVPHPLALNHVVWLPKSHPHYNLFIEIDILGYYILVSQQELPDNPTVKYLHRSLQLVSWKTGDVTCLRAFTDDLSLGTAHQPLVVDPDDNLIALIYGTKNRLEICKLMFRSHGPCLETLCFLELPPLKPNIRCVISMAKKEWVATSRNQELSPSSRRRLVPFRSCKICTLFLSLDYTPSDPPHRYGMIVSVTALLSAARSYRGDVTTIPWVGWGPAATHIFPSELSSHGLPRYNMATPAGPFWVMGDTQLRLVIQDYDWLRKWQMQKTIEDTSSLSRPTVTAAKAIGQHWVAGEVETHLPHRDVITIESRDDSLDGTWALLDREWFIGISHMLLGPDRIVVHHIG